MWIDIFLTYKHIMGVIAYTLISVFTSAHILVHKRHHSSLVGWLGVVWLSPFLGAVVYWMFGFNRIYRKKRSQRDVSSLHLQGYGRESEMSKLQKFTQEVTQLPLTHQNHIDIFAQPTDAFTNMLASISSARHSITLCSYIFDGDDVGHAFVSALSDAEKRGVLVRILIDSMGLKYSMPSIVPLLKKHNLVHAIFLPTLLPWKMPFLNLRNHRKIMVVDGQRAFTGGMNIRGSMDPNKQNLQDIHFAVEGPVVDHIQKTFIEDWAFTTNEILDGSTWFSHHEPCGVIKARGIADGPDEDYDTLRRVFLSAIDQARKRIQIVTPYFLPDESILDALGIAAKSGVQVQIVVPARSNIQFVGWASMVCLTDLVALGCEVYRTPQPFDHSKVFLADDDLAYIGSANWDDRSLRLNFEFNLACYDEQLVLQLRSIVDQKILQSTPLSPEYYQHQPFWVHYRDLSSFVFKEYI